MSKSKSQDIEEYFNTKEAKKIWGGAVKNFRSHRPGVIVADGIYRALVVGMRFENPVASTALFIITFQLKEGIVEKIYPMKNAGQIRRLLNDMKKLGFPVFSPEQFKPQMREAIRRLPAVEIKIRTSPNMQHIELLTLVEYTSTENAPDSPLRPAPPKPEPEPKKAKIASPELTVEEIQAVEAEVASSLDEIDVEAGMKIRFSYKKMPMEGTIDKTYEDQGELAVVLSETGEKVIIPAEAVLSIVK